MANQNRLQENKDHRSHLLYSLGFQKPIQQCSVPVEEIQHINLLSADTPIRRPLNDASENYRSCESLFSNIIGRKSSRKQRSVVVRFDNEVTIQPIASHKQYSKRIRNELWNDSKNIQENAYRNRIEYEAEGMEWEFVLEEEDMYVDPQTGERIHPFWVDNEHDENEILFSS